MDGRAHDASTLLLATTGFLLLRPYQPDGALAFALASLAGGLFLSPDLDLDYSRPSRRWSLLRFLWAPYRALHKHRGRSHTYLYGPLSRLAYLALLGTAVWWGAGQLVPIEVPPPAKEWAERTWPFLLAGYLASQWLHLLMDGIRPFAKR